MLMTFLGMAVGAIKNTGSSSSTLLDSIISTSLFPHSKFSTKYKAMELFLIKNKQKVENDQSKSTFH